MSSENVLFLDLKRENAAFEPELSNVISETISAGWYVGGEANEVFEQNWADFCGTKYALGVSNGLDAIELLLRAYDIGPGDSVIVPANTYIATWLAVSAVGARIIPIEPDPVTFNIEVDLIRQAIAEDTKAVLGVHLYGQSMDFVPIRAECDRRGLVFIEDAAQAHGARKDNVVVGAQGHAAAFSFYPGKNLGALGDGGAVTTDDREIIEKIRLLRNYGSAVKYVNEVRGKNCRLDTIQAAILNLKMKRLDQSNQLRRKIAARYIAELNSIEGLSLPTNPVNTEEHVWHLFVVQTQRRDKLKEYLAKNNIQTLCHYPIPPFSQRAYSDLNIEEDQFPISSQIHRNCLSLPISATHTTGEIDYTCNVIRDFFS